MSHLNTTLSNTFLKNLKWILLKSCLSLCHTSSLLENLHSLKSLTQIYFLESQKSIETSYTSQLRTNRNIPLSFFQFNFSSNFLHVIFSNITHIPIFQQNFLSTSPNIYKYIQHLHKSKLEPTLILHKHQIYSNAKSIFLLTQEIVHSKFISTSDVVGKYSSH